MITASRILSQMRCLASVFALIATVAWSAACATEVSGDPVAAPPVVTATTSTTSALPPGPDLQTLVLPRDDVRRIMNDQTLVKTSTGRHPSIALGVAFTPPQCGVVAGNGMHAELDGSGQTGVYYVGYISTTSAFVQVDQGVVAFADPGAAHAIIGAQQAVWQQCANTDLGTRIGDQAITQHIGALQVNGDVLTIQLSLGPSAACTRTMAAKNQFVVDNVVCSPDPAAAAAAILTGMLDKIAP